MAASPAHPSPDDGGLFVPDDVPPALADLLREIGPPRYRDVPLDALRSGYVESRRPLAPEPPALASVMDQIIGGPAGPLRVRIYRANFGWRPVPALLFLHGGGWTIGSLESHDTLCRQLAAASGHTVVAVDYRLAPEHPYPAALDDAWAALTWLAASAERLAIDPLAIGVAGDSAGGNLAAVLALKARDEGGPHLKTQVLIYPCTDLNADRPSHHRRANGYLMSREQYLWYVDNYVNGADRNDWRLSPLLADSLAGLPPAVILTAGLDVLQDEGREYAARLAGSGVPVLHTVYPDMVHGFITLGGRLPQAQKAVADIAKGLASFDIYNFIDGAGI
ncbi:MULTISPECIES: alpha/beta hydrolase [Nitrospirillum]|uniref:Acetyl esterase n=1 Tax=Nitrospirillum amazonense TaxID=28077 RepID=A0A560FY17_9PROT|nr:alpha/beta hydrolase [Nitrospirillum amazonense]MEC4593529.1 alpha/beta hydrolase [Nitrospirillum amazonense]TWB26380.1 acetyl esterase [Nitrospirillum amazonense]